MNNGIKYKTILANKTLKEFVKEDSDDIEKQSIEEE